MILKKILVFLFVVMLLGGCSIIGHIDQLQAMGKYSKEKDNQHKIVKNTDAMYDSLVKAIQSNKIKNYPDKSSIRRNFGDPIITKTLEVNGETQEQWLYRQRTLY